MNKKQLSLLGLMALAAATGCKKNNDIADEKLSLNNRTTAYTPVSEPISTKIVDASVLDTVSGSATGGNAGISFDNHQAWFDFTKISSATADKGRATLRSAWNLAFWNGSALNRVILNYSVTTQASLISGETQITTAIGQNAKLEAAYNLITGGTLGMGDLSTFDFHRDNQFVIGTPLPANRVYLIKTPPVQLHPDTTGTPAVTVEYWLAANRWNGGTLQYFLQYKPVVRTSSGTWAFLNPSATPTTLNISKNASYQYTFVNLAKQSITTIQPQNSDWNLGLSAVTLKRYMNGGGSYPFAVKGVVLNNNSGVKVYRVQSTASSAGAPGPFDPNFSGSGSSDPALNSANSIESQFVAFNAADIVDANFSSTNEEEIGQYWRYLDMGNYRIFVDRFYVIKLPNGDVYKLKFDNLTTGTTSNPVNNGMKYRFTKIATN